MSETRSLGSIEKRLLNNRQSGNNSFIAFLNAGDPDLYATRELIELLERCRVDVIELCVPFPDSCTDGDTILRSHDRALKNRVTLDAVLEMVQDVRKRCLIPIVLMADFGHTVKPCGLQKYLQRCKQARVDGTLLHCLPPAMVAEYSDVSSHLELENIFSLYPITKEAKRKSIYAMANGFIYLVSQYGKTGSGNNLSESFLSYLEKVRKETTLPLAVGFGVKSNADVNKVVGVGADGVIIGSKLVEIIEANMHDQTKMHFDIHALFHQLRNGAH